MRENKVTNVTSDREVILLWLGDKSSTTQVSYNSVLTQFLEFVNKPLCEVLLEDLQLWKRRLDLTY